MMLAWILLHNMAGIKTRCCTTSTYDKFISGLCGEFQAKAEKEGTILPYYDSQIAATAISNGLVLVTHNVNDFLYTKEKACLHIEDWFVV